MTIIIFLSFFFCYLWHKGWRSQSRFGGTRTPCRYCRRREGSYGPPACLSRPDCCSSAGTLRCCTAKTKSYRQTPPSYAKRKRRASSDDAKENKALRFLCSGNPREEWWITASKNPKPAANEMLRNLNGARPRDCHPCDITAPVRKHPTHWSPRWPGQISPKTRALRAGQWGMQAGLRQNARPNAPYDLSTLCMKASSRQI